MPYPQYSRTAGSEAERKAKLDGKALVRSDSEILGIFYPRRTRINGSQRETGGEGGIRTHGEVAPTTVFKTVALNHSATFPCTSNAGRAARLQGVIQPGAQFAAWPLVGYCAIKAGMMRTRLLPLLLLLAACATPAQKPVVVPSAPSPPVFVPLPALIAPEPLPQNAAFTAWLGEYRRRALARGSAPTAVEALLAGIELQPRVLALDRRQPGDSGSATARFDAYLARQVDVGRISLGVAAANRVSDTLAAVHARTGVPGEMLLAIWGVETGYGKVTGKFDVPSALATLAWDGRRAALFTAELDAALSIIEKDLAPRSMLRGSWAGAMGQPQFLPSSFLAYAVDGDGDGRVDIWQNETDALMSIGNYFKQKGWQAGLSWGLPVTVPDGFDRAAIRTTERPKTCVRPLEKHSRWLTVAEWKARGLTGNAPFPADDVPAALIEPDGDGQGAYLVTRNYRVIMDYNCSNFYALSVALLGDAISTRPR